MLSKCDNQVKGGLWSSGVPPRWDIPISLPSPAADTGFRRFQLAGTGEPSFRGLTEALGLSRLQRRPGGIASGRVSPTRTRQLTPQAWERRSTVSKNSITARHRATPARSIVIEGLSVSAKSLGRPALAVAAASGIAFGVGAPAHAGVNGPDTTETASVQASAAPAAAVAAPAAAAGNVHTVVSGDTLGAIASMHGVSLNDVLSANGLSVSTIIYPGDQIQIPAAGSAPAAAYVAPAATGADA